MVAGTVLATRGPRTNWNDAAFGALVAAFPNTGFMGVPLLVALLGAQSAGPAIVTIVVDMVITTSLCIALSRLDGAGTHGMAVALRNALRGMATNPMPWSIALGRWPRPCSSVCPARWTRRWPCWPIAASPVALFTIGAAGAFADEPARAGADARLRARGAGQLLGAPAAGVGGGPHGHGAGVPLDPFAFTVLVLLAALPSASNVSLLAERFGAHNGRVARIILVSTALAFLSFSAAVALLTWRIAAM